MKSLQDFIIESSQEINEGKDTASITFDFTDLENAKETLKSFENKDYCTIEDNKLTVEITADNVDKLDTVQDILQQYSQTLRSSTKSTNDEQYAQKTKKFAEKVGEFNDAIEELSTSDDNEDE